MIHGWLNPQYHNWVYSGTTHTTTYKIMEYLWIFMFKKSEHSQLPIVQGSTVVNVVKYTVWHEIRWAKKKSCVYSKTDRNKPGFSSM